MNPFLQATLVATTYGLLLLVLVKCFGVKYTEITKNARNIKNGIILPVGIASVALVGLSVFNGWLTPALTPTVASVAWWMWIIPAGMALSIYARFRTAKWHQFTLLARIYLIIGTLLVGFSEEFLTRGVLVQIINQADTPQPVIMLVTSVLFGLMHGLNYFNGQDRKTTVSQVLITTLIGMSLYISLAVSGTLWVPIALHALFDLSLLAQGTQSNGAPRESSSLEYLSSLVCYAATIIAFITLFVSDLVN